MDRISANFLPQNHELKEDILIIVPCPRAPRRARKRTAPTGAVSLSQTGPRAPTTIGGMGGCEAECLEYQFRMLCITLDDDSAIIWETPVLS